MLRDRIVPILSALCYVPFASVVFCLVVLLRYPHSSFAVYHVRQGLALFFVWFFSLFLLSSSLFFGLIFWLVLFFFTFKTGFMALRGDKFAFPYLQNLAAFIPVEKIYSHLTGRAFPSSFIS
jgi:hypothetical protein